MPQVAVLELFGPKVLSIFRRHLNPWVGKMMIRYWYGPIEWPRSFYATPACTIIRMRSPEEKSSTSKGTNFDTAWKPTQNASKLNNSGLGFAELVTKRPPRAKTCGLDSESKDFLMRNIFFEPENNIMNHHRISHQHICSITYTKDLCWCWRKKTTSLRLKTPMRLRRRLCCRGAGSKA